MKLIKALSIRHKILFGFGILIFLSVSVVIFSIPTLVKIQEINNSFIPLVEEIASIRSELEIYHTIEQSLDLYLLVGAEEHRQNIIFAVEKIKKSKYLNNIKNKFVDNVNQLVKVEISDPDVNRLASLCYNLIRSSADALTRKLEDITIASREKSKRSGLIINRLIFGFAIVEMVITLLCLLLAFLLAKALLNGFKLLSKQVYEVSHGNFESRIIADADDEFGQIAAEFNRMAERLMNTTFSLDRVAKILNSLPDMVFITDASFNIKMVNSGSEEQLGFSEMELLDEPISYFIPAIPSYISDDKFEIMVTSKSGKTFPAQISYKSVYDSKGQLTNHVYIARDVSELKLIQETIVKNKNLLKGIFDNMSEGVTIFHYDKGLSDFVISDLNQASALMERIAVDKAVGKRITEILPDNLTQLIFKLFSDVYQTGVSEDRLVHYVDDDAKELWRKYYIFKLVSGELIAVYSDETKVQLETRKKELMQQNLLKSSRLAGMSEVATGVLHNVGNVLNSINVSANLLKGLISNGQVKNLSKIVDLYNKKEPDCELIKKYISLLSDAHHKEKMELLGEVDELLSNCDLINKIVSIQQSITGARDAPEKHLVDDLIDSALYILKGSLLKYNIELKKIYEEKKYYVLISQVDFIQIMVNLVSNAKNALADCDNRNRVISIDIINDYKKKQLTIIVTDNGVGIDPQNIDRIFEYGFTTRKRGHGFGLHNSALKARQLGGGIRASSNGSNAGAVFYFDLPYVAEGARNTASFDEGV